MSNNELLARYESIADVVGRMLAAARREEWDVLVELQDRYKNLVESLKDIDRGVELGMGERQRKFDLLRRILADDAQICDLANPALARLSALIAASRPTRALRETYGMGRSDGRGESHTKK
jgi:flagellar protein FliT